MTKQEELVVYWAPSYGNTSQSDIDWSILYNEPISVMSDMKKDVNKNANANTFLICPAYKDLFKNTFILSSSLGTHLKINEVTQEFESQLENYVGGSRSRDETTLLNRPHLRLNLGWAIFAEEPVVLEVTAPYFSGAKHMRYGTLVPGTYDAGSWFRSANPEIVLNKDETEFVLEDNEPIMYIRFLTDKKIVFKRFIMNQEIQRIEGSCVQHPRVFGRNKPLSERYAVFNRTRMNKKLIQLIKNSLIT